MSVSAFVLTAVVLAPVSGEVAKGELIRPAVAWNVMSNDKNLLDARPKSGLITDRDSFALLWKAWRESDPAPAVDFSAYFVVVTFYPGKPLFLKGLWVDEKGDAMLSFQGYPSMSPRETRFGFSIGVMPRDKVKTYYGKEVAK